MGPDLGVPGASMLAVLNGKPRVMPAFFMGTLDASGHELRGPSPRTAGRGPRLFLLDKPTAWQAGYHLGAAQRAVASR